MIWVSPMLPKFTHRESLTPEPPNLIGAMEPHISQYGIGLTPPNQKWMYGCQVMWYQGQFTFLCSLC